MYQNILFDRVRTLIEAHDFSKPFSLYLKEHFQANPKMGARDRRETRDLCYHFMRIGNNLNEVEFKNKLAVASFLCSIQNSNNVDILISQNSNLPIEKVIAPLDEKIEIVKSSFPEFNVKNIFPDIKDLNDEFANESFYKSFLLQPKIWIRIRKEFVEEVIAELKEAGIDFEQDQNRQTLSFLPMQKLEALLSFQKGYFEIQDLNSQRISEFYHPKNGDVWWDACAASGGKSLALIDKQEDIHLLATDIRENIIRNYTIRMKRVDFKGYNTQVIDLSKNPINPSERFEGIIADVPCSGSGTWSRSPENLLKSHHQVVKETFQPIQRKIIRNVVNNLRAEGTMIYSTCSVFRAENEDNVEFFLKNLPLELIEMKYLSGAEKRADSLFVASFRKVSI